MEQGEADRLHEGLERASRGGHSSIGSRMRVSRSGRATGWVDCSSMPFPPGSMECGSTGPRLESTAALELETAIAEVEQVAVPCWIEVRAKRTPTVVRVARRFGFTNEETIPGMVARRDEQVRVAVPGPKLEVTRVLDRERLDVAAAVAEAGFEAPRGALFPPSYAGRCRDTRTVDLPGRGRRVAGLDRHRLARRWRRRDLLTSPPRPSIAAEDTGGPSRPRQSRGFASGADLAWLQASRSVRPSIERWASDRSRRTWSSEATHDQLAVSGAEFEPTRWPTPVVSARV